MLRKMSLVVLVLTLLALGGATSAQTTQTVYGTMQEFEHGLMIWRSDTGHIWALVDNGVAYSFPASAYSNLPDNPIFGEPPSRLRPIFGFGKVWGNIANVRSQLGWPVRQEIGYNIPISTTGGVTSITQLNGLVIRIAGSAWSRGPVTPTPPPQAPDASILSFGAAPMTASRNATVTVNWQVQGVDLVIIEIYDTADGSFVTSQTTLPLSGSTSVTVPNAIQGDMRVILYGARVVDSGPSISYQRVVQQALVIDVQEAVDVTIATYAAYQRYQRGFMIWRADNEAVYVFYESDGSTGGRYNVYSISGYRGLPDNPIPDGPPSVGLVKPINAFGRIWGNHAAVRYSLGWAIESERGYTSNITLTGMIPQTLSLPNGAAVLMTQYGQWAYV